MRQITCRNATLDDERFLISWCLQRRLPLIPAKYWPPHHYIAVNASGRPVGSVFLLGTHWLTSYVECLLVDPKLPDGERDECIRGLILACCLGAKELGYTQVQTSTQHPSIQRGLEFHGFSTIQENAKILARGV